MAVFPMIEAGSWKTELDLLVAFLLLFKHPKQWGHGSSSEDCLQRPSVALAHYPAENLPWLPPCKGWGPILWALAPPSPAACGRLTSLLLSGPCSQSTHVKHSFPEQEMQSRLVSLANQRPSRGSVDPLQGMLPSSFSRFVSYFPSFTFFCVLWLLFF